MISFPFSANTPGCCEEQQEFREAGKDPGGGDDTEDHGGGWGTKSGWAGEVAYVCEVGTISNSNCQDC